MYLEHQQSSTVIHTLGADVSAANGTVKPHDGGYHTVDLLCGLLLICFNITRRISPNKDVIHHPSKNRMTAMSDLLFQHQLHQLLGGRRHVLETLTKGDDSEAHPFQVLDHLNSSPTVKGDFFDIELLAKLLDELLDVSVMDNITFGGFQEALLLPYIIRNMISIS